MPYISSSGKVYTIDGPRQRRVQLEKPILLAVAMLLCVFVLAIMTGVLESSSRRKGTSRVHGKPSKSMV